MDKRQFLGTCGKALGAGAFLSATSMWSALTQAQGLQTIGTTQHFDLQTLKDQARQLATQAYTPHTFTLPPSIAALTWDQYQSIQFKSDHALWINDNVPLSAKFFHLGLFFKTPVKMHQVIDGQAQELAYDPSMFDYGKSGLNAADFPSDLGFAGFRILSTHDLTRDLAAFLGASYFRAVGNDKQYGLSARGLAVNTGMPFPEEFPEFIGFWLEKPAADAKALTVYALLDSPSIAGAYQFAITPGDTLTMDVNAYLYPRKEIERMGIGPCTSMFQYAENDKRMAWDWRPEIHDSDGLQIHTGSGEWIWRPLVNPEHLRFNAFQDENPKGFGLIQRDRNPDHYQDDGVFYENRPSLWVKPLGQWGKGSVSLVEIPTVDETFDNIVAFWTPAEKPQPQQEYIYQYRLYWGALTPLATLPGVSTLMPSLENLAHCADTYTGLGGVVGQKRTVYSKRFVVDFVGNAFNQLQPDAEVQAVVTSSRGKIELVSARPQHNKKGYRAMFDIIPDSSTDQIDIRLYLKSGDLTLTETWVYQWNPPPVDQRQIY